MFRILDIVPFSPDQGPDSAVGGFFSEERLSGFRSTIVGGCRVDLVCMRRTIWGRDDEQGYKSSPNMLYDP